MTTTVNNIEIDSKLIKTVSKIAKDENITKQKAITDLLRKGIEVKTKSKIPDYLIANKNRKPDPEGFNKLIGSIKTDKPVDVNKIIKEVRRGDI